MTANIKRQALKPTSSDVSADSLAAGRISPDEALFAGKRAVQALASCEHFAGSEKLILKALSLQDALGPVFDITGDCEDGAKAGAEAVHAQMLADLIQSNTNKYARLGVRIHDYTHEAWRHDVDLIVGNAADRLAYVTIPKTTRVDEAAQMISYVQEAACRAGRQTDVPVHLLVETHGALEHVFELARLPAVEVLDFGLMDFVSDHHGVIPASALRSPMQFEHQLLIRAKARVVAAAAAAGIVPAHNVCLNLKDKAVVHADADRARQEFGFQRMWSIYPDQIEPIVEAMQPSFAELEDALAILSLAQDASWGPIQFKGELHDRATYRYFWSLVRRANATGMNLPEDALNRFFSTL